VTTSEREVVTALGAAISQRIGEPRYQLWFERNTRLTCHDDVLVVGVPNHLYLDWLQKTFADAVRDAASAVLGRPMQVRFAIDPELFQAARREQAEVGDRGSVVSSPGSEKRASVVHSSGSEKKDEHSGLRTQDSVPTPDPRPPAPTHKRTRRWHRLGEFVVGACNRVAHASALSVVEAPGQGANPLILHGPVGTGKTHLLEGIYAGLRKQHPEWRVCFVTAEDFTNRFVQAMRLGKLGAFRKHFRECDALLVDDLHFLASKRATQEEFLHTFDALHADGRQLVLTCDCHPKLADEFTPELTDRLLGGAVWSISPPDAETRLDLLRAKAARREKPVPDEVLRYLADKLRGNVRELEGAIHSVQHFSRVAGRAIDLELAREALGDLLRHAVRVVQLADVERAVCGVLRLETGALQAKGRAWMASHPRMLAMYLARKHTAAAYSEIGQHFGGRNHSTVVAAEKKVRQWLQEDGELTLGERPLRIREIIERVERELLR
jgi:chromosomal replication initiator protein